MVVYIEGARDEIAWADEVARLTAAGVIAGPEEARGLTAVEVLGADLETLREDDEDRALADLVVNLRHEPDDV